MRIDILHVLRLHTSLPQCQGHAPRGTAAILIGRRHVKRVTCIQYNTYVHEREYLVSVVYTSQAIATHFSKYVGTSALGVAELLCT